MTLSVTLLGTGSPMPSPDRAGPATLISAGDGPDAEHYLVDAGRGVLMRLAAAGLGAPNLTAVLITHLHSDHITDLNDVITTRWIMTFVETPLTIVGPVGTQRVVDHILASPDDRRVVITCGQTDHKPVEPSVGFRFDHRSDRGVASVVAAGDTVPCEGLDALCAGAQAVVHTVIRKDIIANVPMQRMQDTLDYHSSPEEAAQTAARAGLYTLILTHYVPPMPLSGTEDDWRALAAAHFGGTIELGDDLHRIDIHPTT